MTTRDCLVRYLEERGLRERADATEELYTDQWVRIPIGSRRVPVFPVRGIKNALILHDIHHMVMGYGTDWDGEFEIAGWELGSGGCAGHTFMWFDRAFSVLLGLIFAPKATVHAFRQGASSRNLYRLELDRVLGMDIEEVRDFVRNGSA